jgi:hypothetical protein
MILDKKIFLTTIFLIAIFISNIFLYTESFNNNNSEVSILNLVLYSSDNGGPYDRMRNLTDNYYKRFHFVTTYYYCFKPDLEKEISNVDAYFGTRDLPLLLKTLGADYKHELVGERLLTTPRHFAYMKIAEGCDRPCSFCAIPLMRGNHISKPIEELVQEAKTLAANGTKELLLIAQDSTYYGLDL